MNDHISQPGDGGIFRISPFSVIADSVTAACWSGRPETLEVLHRLRRSLERRPDSSLDVLWANFGSGKTHTLFHLAHLLNHNSVGESKTFCVYIDMPQQVSSFHELFMKIVSRIPMELLGEVLTTVPPDRLNYNLRQAGNVISVGNSAQKQIAYDWLRGERIYLRELKGSTGITQRIENDTVATEVLSQVVAAFANSKIRLVIMIDEFQRIGWLDEKKKNRTLSAIRSIFNANPRFFSMILAIYSLVEENALLLVPEELKTLLGMRPMISLPEFNYVEAKDFILGRLKFFRSDGYAGDPLAPFTMDGIDNILRHLNNEEKDPLIPRKILQIFAKVFDEALDPDSGIGTDEVRKILGNP